MDNRNTKIDILRGIAMILIVLGHCKCPFKEFIYLFHVAIFFMISGYCFKENKIKTANDLKKYIIIKIKRLYIPFIIGNIICIILNNVFIKFNLYDLENHSIFYIKDYITNIGKVLLFRGHTEMLGATWFLEILFYVSILYAIVDYILYKTNVKYKLFVHTIIALILLLIGNVFITNNINSLFNIQILMCYILFDIGNKIKRVDSIKLKIDIIKINILKILMIVCSFGLLCFLYKCGNIEISKNQYTNPLYFIIVSILGWAMLYGLSDYLSKIKYIDNVLIYIGKRTMIILFLHFIFFKVVNFIGTIFLNKNIELTSKHPVAFEGGIWWIVYAFIGITMPLLIETLTKKIKKEWRRLRSECV